MKTYCITGISGYIGGLLAKKLSACEDTRVIGIDLNPPPDLNQTDFFQVDIRGKEIIDILRNEKVDTLIHLAFYTLPEGDANYARSVNIEGTKNILLAAAAAKIKRLVLASSSAAYGSHEDNPVPIKETDPLRPNKNYYYSAHKAEQEEIVRKFCSANSDIQTIILRPCVVIGPHINNQTGDTLRQKVLINIKNPLIPIQLIYEDDVAEAFFVAATSDKTGVFNIAGAGTLTFPDIGKALNKFVLLLPFNVLSTLASIAKMVKLSPVGGKSLQFIKNPVVVDASKFKETFNFKPKYDSLGAIKQYAATTS